MQVVLLAAGKGARLRPLTNRLPKPLIQIDGKTLLTRILEDLPKETSEIFLIVNHLRDQIIDAIGPSFGAIPIRYVLQDPLTGTAGALHLVKDLLDKRFLVINTDNIYEPGVFTRLLTHEQSILITEVSQTETTPAIIKQDLFYGLAPSSHPPYQVICGAYVLNRSFFDLPLVEIQVGAYREFGLPHTLAQSHHPIHAVFSSLWYSIGTPEELAFAKQHLSILSRHQNK